MAKLESGGGKAPPIEPSKLDALVTTHLISPALLLKDDFNAFMADRQAKLLHLIERATGKPSSVMRPNDSED